MPRRAVACLLGLSLVAAAPAWATSQPIPFNRGGVVLGAAAQPHVLASPTGLPTTSAADEASSAVTILNELRSDYGTSAVQLDSSMSAAAAQHANYMAVNGEVTHTELPTKSGYTATGHTAGLCGNEASDGYHLRGLPDAVLGWAQAPFHEIGELAPSWTYVGIGRRTATGADAYDYSSLTCDTTLGAHVVPNTSVAGYPLTYPADGGRLPWTTWSQDEVPSPVPTCSKQGIGNPTGANLLATFGALHGVVRNATATLADDTGARLPVCVIDETNLLLDDSGLDGTPILAQDHSVVVLAEKNLQAGHSYHWSVTADGTTVNRSFTVAKRDLVIGPGSDVQCHAGSCAVYGVAHSINDLSPTATAGPVTLQLQVTSDGSDPALGGTVTDTRGADVQPGYSGASLSFGSGRTGAVRFIIAGQGDGDDASVSAASCSVVLPREGSVTPSCTEALPLGQFASVTPRLAVASTGKTTVLTSGCITVTKAHGKVAWSCPVPMRKPGSRVDVQQKNKNGTWSTVAHLKANRSRTITFTRPAGRKHLRATWPVGRRKALLTLS